MNSEQQFQLLHHTPSDINEHLPTLRKYAEECDIVVEMGVRYVVSTWAFVTAKPKTLISVDIKHPAEFGASNSLDRISSACELNGTKFSFVLGDSRSIDLPEHDLLFIDTLHDYAVLKEELRVQSPKTKKYIVMHDTQLFGRSDESGGGIGLIPAIEEFLAANSEWVVKESFLHNNGLTILARTE